LVGKDASADGSVLFAHNEVVAGKPLVNYYKGMPLVTSHQR